VPSRCVKSSSGSREINDLFSSLLICEMLKPSARFWLFSPWISDTVIVDNRYKAVSAFFPQIKGPVRLADVIAFLSKKGSKIKMVTTKDSEAGEGTERFLRRIKEIAPFTEVRYDTNLHEKGVLTDNFYLAGSMNFTYNGLNIKRESIFLSTDKSQIASQNISFAAYWDSLKKEKL